MNTATFGQSPYLTTKHAAEYLDFSGPEAFYKWAKRQNLTALRRGRTLVWDRRDLDAALRRRGASAA